MSAFWWMLRAAAIGLAVGVLIPEQPKSMIVALAVLVAVQADHEARK